MQSLLRDCKMQIVDMGRAPHQKSMHYEVKEAHFTGGKIAVHNE
jgi:hypothetical protein